MVRGSLITPAQDGGSTDVPSKTEEWVDNYVILIGRMEELADDDEVPFHVKQKCLKDIAGLYEKIRELQLVMKGEGASGSVNIAELIQSDPTKARSAILGRIGELKELLDMLDSMPERIRVLDHKPEAEMVDVEIVSGGENDDDEEDEEDFF